MQGSSSSVGSTTAPPNNFLPYPCPFCPRTFESGKALGGQQNADKEERKLGRRASNANPTNENRPVVGSPSPVNVQPPAVWYGHPLGVQPWSDEHGQGSMTGLGYGLFRIQFLAGNQLPVTNYHCHFYPEPAQQEAHLHLTVDFLKEWVPLANFGGGEPSSERTLADPNVRAVNGIENGVEVNSEEKAVDLELKLWF